MQKQTERKDVVANDIGAKRERTRAASGRENASARPNGIADVGDATQAAINTEMRRLMRKAAWSRMFGNAGPRNPYAK